MKQKKIKARLFNIQRFSIHDGPGIRTTLFFKGCSLQCSWCQNPESFSFQPEIGYYRDQCAADMKCITACPENALHYDKGVHIDKSLCTGCAICAEYCSYNALRLFGTAWESEELVSEVLKDKHFFDDSGGGVTLSGGEPLNQSPFLKQFVPVLKKHSIDVTVQTCGYFSWVQAEPFLSDVDRIFFDIKHYNSELHQHYTGRDNRLILANLKKLLHVSTSLIVRIPLIPGVNDSEDDIACFSSLLQDYGLYSVVLIAYHQLGIDKFNRLQLSAKPFKVEPHSEKERENIVALFHKGNINASFTT